jgi:hypothetical protein
VLWERHFAEREENTENTRSIFVIYFDYFFVVASVSIAVLCCAVLCCVGWCAMDLRRAVLVSQKEATHGGTVMGRGVITVNCMSWHDNFLLYNLFNYKTRHNNNQHKRVLLTLMVADGGAVVVCDMQCLRADKWEVCNDR